MSLAAESPARLGPNCPGLRDVYDACSVPADHAYWAVPDAPTSGPRARRARHPASNVAVSAGGREELTVHPGASRPMSPSLSERLLNDHLSGVRRLPWLRAPIHELRQRHRITSGGQDSLARMESWRAVSLPDLPGRGPEPRLVDTATGEPAVAAQGHTARIYACGITPYDATHIGHAATYTAWDLLVRALAGRRP